jgi:hypothetical protein
MPVKMVAAKDLCVRCLAEFTVESMAKAATTADAGRSGCNAVMSEPAYQRTTFRPEISMHGVIGTNAIII